MKKTKKKMLFDLETMARFGGMNVAHFNLGEADLFVDKYKDRMIKFAEEYDIKLSTNIDDYYSNDTGANNTPTGRTDRCGFAHYMAVLNKIKQSLLED